MHFFCYSDPAPWTVRQRSAWFLEVCRDRARLHCNPARAQAVIVSVVGVAMLMPIGVFLTKACGGTCCGLFSCCGLTWIAWLALKALMFAAWLPVRILCCVRRFERDRQARRPAGPRLCRAFMVAAQYCEALIADATKHLRAVICHDACRSSSGCMTTGVKTIGH